MLWSGGAGSVGKSGAISREQIGEFKQGSKNFDLSMIENQPIPLFLNAL